MRPETLSSPNTESLLVKRKTLFGKEEVSVRIQYQDCSAVY